MDSLDITTMKLVLPDNTDEWIRMDAAAIECFLNSDGEYKDFGFDGRTYEVIRYSDPLNNRSEEASVVIYRDSDAVLETSAASTPPTESPTAVPSPVPATEDAPADVVNQENLLVGIIGGADGPTAVFVTGSPVRAIIPIVFGLLLVIAAILCIMIWRKKRKSERP